VSHWQKRALAESSSHLRVDTAWPRTDQPVRRSSSGLGPAWHDPRRCRYAWRRQFGGTSGL